MKYGFWFVILALSVPYIAGCTGGKGPDATDSAFEANLEKAAAKNKTAPVKSGGRKLPPEIAAHLGKGATTP